MNRKLVVLLCTGLAMALPVNASATLLTFQLNDEFGGGTLPTGAPPWVVAMFDDGGSAGTVTLTLNTLGLGGSEFLKEFAFNVDPAVNPASISFANEDTTDVGAPPNFVLISAAVSGLPLLGPSGPLFNLIFGFEDNDFTSNETYSIDLIHPGITAASFNFPNNFSNGLPVGAFVTTSGPGFEFGLITSQQIPESGTLALMGLGLVGFGYRRRLTRCFRR